MSFYVPLYFIVYCLEPSWFICERTKKVDRFFRGSGYLSEKTESHFLLLYFYCFLFCTTQRITRRKRRYNFFQLSIAAAGQNKTSGKIHLTSSQEIGEEKKKNKGKRTKFPFDWLFSFYLSLFCDLWNPSGFNFVPFILPLKNYMDIYFTRKKNNIPVTVGED